MSENLWVDTLGGLVQVDSLQKWITNTLTDEEKCLFDKYNCGRSDFISYILNFIHEKAIINDKHGETPQKIHTPKSIRNQEVHTVDQRSVQRRSALFETSNVNETPKVTSTPKLTNKTDASEQDSRFNLSNISHTSPMHSRLMNLGTPKNVVNSRSNAVLQTPKSSKSRSYQNNSHERSSPSICLADYIVPKKSSQKKKGGGGNADSEKKARRINPTSAAKNLSQTFFSTSNSFNFNNSVSEMSPENTNDQRNFLAEERKKILMRTPSTDVQTQNKMKLAIMNKQLIKPNPELVTCKKELNICVELFSFMLQNNIVLNITGEIHFLISLLLCNKHNNPEETSDASNVDNGVLSLFDSFHNNIYFSANVLCKNVNLMKFLDCTSLQMLVENERFKAFVNEVPDVSFPPRQKVETSSDSFGDAGRLNVCFNSDTDNRENFPNDHSFHAFRKQRDLFYEILMFWEQNHMSNSWNFASSLGGKVRTLLSINMDTSNYRHLAKLFKAQLLGSCSKSTIKEEGLHEQQLQFFSDIPNIDTEKLNRLKNRLVTKKVTNGINAIPTFHGVQEFYKDFIITSASYGFNEHLKDTFLIEIIELNDTNFPANDFEESDTSVDTTTKNKFLQCVSALRILAKFLGYMESMPYHTDNLINEKILAAELHTRKFCRPRLDILSYLKHSFDNGSLVLTIPWIVKYLAMLDYVSIRLPYYKEVLEILFGIYSKRSEYNHDLAKDSYILIDLCIGWLFELPHFPSELYFSFLEKEFKPVTKKEKVQNGHNSTTESDMPLDSLDMIDNLVLYTCCPYLEEVKQLIHTNKSNSGSIKIKHITPLTASESLTELTEKRLKSQMEDGFFNNQPLSVRKTVDFVSERVASACVKKICGQIVPEYKKRCVEKFEKFCSTVDSEKTPRPDLIKLLTKKSNEVGEECLKELRDVCNKEVDSMTEERINGSIKYLLSSEEVDAVKNVCCFIAKRLSTQKVQQWMSSHINTNIFVRELDIELQKFVTSIGKSLKEKPIYALPPSGRSDKIHDETTKSSIDLVFMIQEYTCQLERESVNISQSDLLNLHASIKESLEKRCDLNDAIISVIMQSSLDAILMTISKKPYILPQGNGLKSIITKFIKLYKEHEKNIEDLLDNLVCPRNSLLMMQSGNLEKTWEVYADFLTIIINSGVLSASSFETQCLRMYRKELDPITLGYLSKFFKRIAGKYGLKEEHLAFLLDFLSDFCADL